MDETLKGRLAIDLDGSFESLVREHQDRLYGLAFRYVGNASDAEDLAQDAFVRAYRALANYDGQRIRDLDLRAWLTTILLNACRNHLARPAHRATAGTIDVEAASELASDGRHSPEARVERRETAERWAGLVASLPPVYRAAVLLRHLDGMAYDEMSAVLGRPEGTLKAQVHRGLALLRAAFDADERARLGGGAGQADSPGSSSRRGFRTASVEAAS